MADQTPPPAKQFTVAIVGGGIGGLCLAIGLLRRSVPVHIYEAAPAFGETGLGLSIGPAAHRAMPMIDPHIREIYDSLVTTHADSPGFEAFRDTWFEAVWATGDREGELMHDLKALPSGQTSVRRADFLDALVRLVPKECVSFGKRLDTLVELDASASASADGDNDHGRVQLTFADGTTAAADVVVGCDGIRSRVKESMLSPDEVARTQPQYSGMYGYRAVLDMDTAIKAVGEHRARVSTWYVGKGAYGITYPIQRANKVNVGLYTLKDSWDSDKWVRPAERADMERDFGYMGKYVNALMEHMTDSSQWAIFEHPPISTFCRSRVAILGDAAHASTPHQGAGAGQAIEDAHVLAEVLADPGVVTPADAVAAFKGYDAVRRPRSQRVVSTSRENGHVLCLSYDGVGDDLDKLTDMWTQRFKWLWDLDVQAHADEAKKAMREAKGTTAA